MYQSVGPTDQPWDAGPSSLIAGSGQRNQQQYISAIPAVRPAPALLTSCKNVLQKTKPSVCLLYTVLLVTVSAVVIFSWSVSDAPADDGSAGLPKPSGGLLGASVSQVQVALPADAQEPSNSTVVVYDQIVVGGGIVGLWIANELARAGQHVLLLEQFHRSHQRGSSAGSSRAVELHYPSLEGAPTVKESLKMFRELQQETGVSIIKNTTLLVLTEDPFDNTPFPEILEVMEKVHGIKLDHLQRNEMAAMFPDGYLFNENDHAIYDNMTATEVIASNAIEALWISLASKKNVDVVGACPVTKVTSEKQADGQEIVKVSCKTRKTLFSAKSVILATGAWTASIDIVASSEDGEKKIKIPEVKPIMYMELFFKRKPEAKCSDVGFLDLHWPQGAAGDVYEVAWGRPTYNTHTDHDFLVGVTPDNWALDPSNMIRSPIELQTLVDKTKSYVRRRLPCLDENPTLAELSMHYRVPAPFGTGTRPLNGTTNVYLTIEGNTFGAAPGKAKKLAEAILGKQAKPATS